MLPYRSNIPKLAEFTFGQLDAQLPAPGAGQAGTARHRRRHATTARARPGNTPSIAPRYLGLRAVIAESFARIHWQNLANFGVLAVEFADPADYDRIEAGDVLSVDGLTDALGVGR